MDRHRPYPVVLLGSFLMLGIPPNVVMFPRAVPGSRKVMALFTAHHGQTHGAVGLIDVRRVSGGDAHVHISTRVEIWGECGSERPLFRFAGRRSDYVRIRRARLRSR